MESVHYFVRGLFRGIPETEIISEQREELEMHINERIFDTMAQGHSHDEAFGLVVESLGNLDELIDTMTGERKKLYEKKTDWYMMACVVIYGTVYMIAVGIWFWFNGFNSYAICIAIPGWLGFAIPALFSWIDYRRHPKAVNVVRINHTEELHASIFGWVFISLACLVMNLLLVESHTFLSVIWAWIPAFGILTWPIMVGGKNWMIRNMKSLEPVSGE